MTSARFVAIGNAKGRVGKTITAVTLGHLPAIQGRRVLIVDAPRERPERRTGRLARLRLALQAEAQRVIDNLVDPPAGRTLQGRESGRHIVFERDGRSRGAAYVS